MPAVEADAHAAVAKPDMRRLAVAEHRPAAGVAAAQAVVAGT